MLYTTLDKAGSTNLNAEPAIMYDLFKLRLNLLMKHFIWNNFICFVIYFHNGILNFLSHIRVDWMRDITNSPSGVRLLGIATKRPEFPSITRKS